MGNTKDTGFLRNLISYDASGNIVLPANLTVTGSLLANGGGSYATQSYVTTQISNLVNAAPGALDTLNELATALGNDANFSTTVTNSIATKLALSGGTLTGGLTGTTASFSSTVLGNSYVQGGYLIGSGSVGLVLLTSADWGASSSVKASSTIDGGNFGAYLSFNNPASKGFTWTVNNASVATLSSTGAATFASNLITNGSLSTVGFLNYNSGDGNNWYINPPANGPTIRLKYHGGSTNRNGGLGWVDNSGNRYDALTWQDNYVGVGTTSPSNKLEVFDTDGSGVRTSPINILTITAENPSNPYDGFGGGLLFKNRIYSGGPSAGGIQNGARIRTSLRTNSSVNYGTELIFDVTTTGNGSLTEMLRLSYTDGATFYSSIRANGSIRSVNGGVDGTYQDAFVGIYSSNNNEQNAIQTAVSSAASASGFRFQVSNGGGSTGRTTMMTLTRSNLSISNEAIIGAQGGSDYTYISGGSGYGSVIRNYYATGTINNEFRGNGNNYVNLGYGSFGVGTSNPVAKLHVSGGKIIHTSDDGGYGQFQINASTTSTEATILLSNGGSGVNNGNYTNVGVIGMGAYGGARDTLIIGTGYNAGTMFMKNGTTTFSGNVINSSNYKGLTFIQLPTCIGWSTSVTNNTQTTISTTGLGLPAGVKAISVVGWYHIRNYGAASGQGDHATAWFGISNDQNPLPWADPNGGYPYSSNTFTRADYGSFVMEHDGDGSIAAGSSAGMHYYGSWHNGIINVNSNGTIYCNLASGYSGGTHYFALYIQGYWI